MSSHSLNELCFFYPNTFVFLSYFVFHSNELECNCCSGCSGSRQTVRVRSVPIQSVQHSPLALCWKTLQWRHQANAMKTTASKDARWRRQMERVHLLHDCVTSKAQGQAPSLKKMPQKSVPKFWGSGCTMECLAAKRVAKLLTAKTDTTVHSIDT